ncbi:hypothetical protein FLA_0372 [Filimonas lacunae]|nr:hypothetical protein FLA_0372 [Filimonas lacunae]
MAALHANSQIVFHDNAPCINGSGSSGNFIDWTTETYTIYTNSLGPRTVQSPYFSSGLTNPNTVEFSQYTLKDFANADGWELIQYDFGNPTVGTDFPYLILYNKRTGLLRVFVAFANLLNQNNAITIELKYVDNESRSAVLENFSGTGRHATENFNNNVAPIGINNFYLNQILYWYHADFYLQYDPCICNFETALELNVKLASSSTLQFNIEGTAIQNLGPGVATDLYGRTGNIGNQANATSPLSSIVSVLKNAGKGAEWAADLVKNKNNYLNLKPTQISKLSSLFSSISNILPGVAGAADFLITLFNGSSAEPPRPLVLDISLHGTGSIVTSSPYGYKKLIVPGSEQTLMSTIVKPYYNNSPGIFTLLKEPIVRNAFNYVYYDEWTPESHEFLSWSTFKLQDNISYTVNPNAGFDLSQSEITASIIYTDGNQSYETDYYGLGCLKDVVKNFDYYEYNGWLGHMVTGWSPGIVKIKIVAKFKVAGSSTVVPYVAVYETKAVSDYVMNPDSDDYLPDASCATTLAPATTAEIKALCNGSPYQNKVTQYLRVDPSVIDTSNAGIDTSAFNRNSAIKIYPNPTSDLLNVDLTAVPGSRRATLLIYDMKGTLQKTDKVQTGTINPVHVDQLTKGLYIVNILYGDKKTSYKIIKL